MYGATQQIPKQPGLYQPQLTIEQPPFHFNGNKLTYLYIVFSLLSFFPHRMLNEMEDDLDTATTNLGLVTAKTKELIVKSGGKRNFIIIVALTLIVVVLFFLIIYT